VLASQQLEVSIGDDDEIDEGAGMMGCGEQPIPTHPIALPVANAPVSTRKSMPVALIAISFADSETGPLTYHPRVTFAITWGDLLV